MNIQFNSLSIFCTQSRLNLTGYATDLCYLYALFQLAIAMFYYYGSFFVFTGTIRLSAVYLYIVNCFYIKLVPYSLSSYIFVHYLTISRIKVVLTNCLFTEIEK